MRLGSLPYLNVKPLVHYLEHGGLPEGWELVYAPPSQLARMLQTGEIAAAPVSSYAVLADSELDVCPGLCISSRGAVKSVLMLSKTEVDLVRSVALDTSSLTGANMLKIILAEAYGLTPEFSQTSPDAISEALERFDAVLVIGNPAMMYPKWGLHVLDIGDEWMKLTGLPAVFALWAGRNLTSELIEVLHRSYEESRQRIEQIAREEALGLGLSYDLCYDYLARTIKYELDEPELASLEVFREKCLRHGLFDVPLYPAKIAAL